MVADATYRTFRKVANGNLLTARVRLAALPFHAAARRTLLDRAAPRWEESLGGTWLLERRSFAAFSFLPQLWYFFWWCAWCLGGSQTTVYGCRDSTREQT